MTRESVKELYFDWICKMTECSRFTKGKSYVKLLSFLHEKDFNYILPKDGNREADGIDLRYRFCYEKNLKCCIAANFLDDRPCSVLEMTAALALRCEEQIAGDLEEGDRTGEWFWKMIFNLGLGGMDDFNFDREEAETVIDIFLRRRYKPNGEGGLFVVHRKGVDLRRVEIWYQAMWYFDEIFSNYH